MAEYIKKNVQLQILVFFLSMPLIIWAVGNFPQRTMLKESLSVVTITAFSLVIGLFYLTRANRRVLQNVPFGKVVKLHKLVGYIAVPILLLHPLFLVVPRFYEAGLTPGEAFQTIITTFSNSGVVFGLTSWSLLLLLGVTSLLRQKIPLQYQTWRVIHYILAMLCIFSALFHVIDLGRHLDLIMTGFVVLLATGGIYQSTKKVFSRRNIGE